MGKIVIEGILATTDLVPAYGGVALPEDALHKAAEDIRKYGLPLTIDHDARHRLNPEVQKVEIRRTDSGSLALWVQFLVDEREWDRVGNRMGFSVAGVVHTVWPDVTLDKPVIEIFADAGQFDDATFNAAAVSLHRNFSVGGGQLYQFSEFPPAKVVLDIAWDILQAIAPSLLASTLYDGLKYFLKPKHASESVFHFVVRRGDHVTSAHLRTSDSQALKEALATWQEVILANPDADSIEYENDSHLWRAGHIDAPSLHITGETNSSDTNRKHRQSARRRKRRHRR